MDIDENSPLMRSLKTAFYERAYGYAAELENQVKAGLITSQEAVRRLVEIMSQSHEMEAVVAASAQYQAPH